MKDFKAIINSLQKGLMTAGYPDLCEYWNKLDSDSKTAAFRHFTKMVTPTAWQETLSAGKMGFKYIRGDVGYRMANFLFGEGGWKIDIQHREIIDGKECAVMGDLVFTWFDGKEKRVPTAGAGKAMGNFSLGDAMKASITDAVKKGLANLVLFSDIYSKIMKQESAPVSSGGLTKEEAANKVSQWEEMADMGEPLDLDKLQKGKTFFVNKGWEDLATRMADLISFAKKDAKQSAK